jgi:hypothetical protein
MPHRTFILIFIMAVILPPISADAAPVLQVNPKEYDFNDVGLGNKATAKLTVRNAGDETLIIRRVRTSCGCTKADVAKNELDPKESTELTVKFDATGLKAGKNIKTVYLTSNDRNSTVTNVRIFANVVRDVFVEPANLVTKLTGSGKRVEFSMTALNRSAGPVTLELSKVQGALKTAEMIPQKVTVSPNSESTFTLRLDAKGEGDKNASYLSGRLVLETSHSKEEWIGVPYFIKLKKSK